MSGLLYRLAARALGTPADVRPLPPAGFAPMVTEAALLAEPPTERSTERPGRGRGLRAEDAHGFAGPEAAPIRGDEGEGREILVVPSPISPEEPRSPSPVPRPVAPPPVQQSAARAALAQPSAVRSGRTAPTSDVSADAPAEQTMEAAPAPPWGDAAAPIHGSLAPSPDAGVRRRQINAEFREPEPAPIMPAARGADSVRPESPGTIPYRTAGTRSQEAAGARPEATEVHVHIGRIEVTAVHEAQRAPRRASGGSKTMTLDEYLSRRGRVP